MRTKQILKDWTIYEHAGLVRLKAEPEQENYFDAFGEPEGYESKDGIWVSPEEEKKELIDMINHLGCYYISSEYYHSGQWHRADAAGMCTGYQNPLNPPENEYVPDLMASALALIPQEGEH